MAPRSILISTVGTSLFRPNLENLRQSFEEQKCSVELLSLANAYTSRDWKTVGEALRALPPSDRICGAEINSITSMVEHHYVHPDCGLFFLHSDTPEGHNIAAVLESYFESTNSPVQTIAVINLQDEDPKRFRTKGLRALSREVCRVIRDRTAAACAINATGGYKAQIAIAVLLGQALSVPVYYKHERFSEIIAFPPMPIALDFEVWMRASGMLIALEQANDPLQSATFCSEWDERYESLVERVLIDGTDYLELSATGQIFHETFRERFRTNQDQVVPPPALNKGKPTLHDHGVINLLRTNLTQFLAKLTREVSFVTRCVTYYCNPDLNEPVRFRVRAGEVEGIFSDGTRTVKFTVHTTATTPGQVAAAVSALNVWLAPETRQ